VVNVGNNAKIADEFRVGLTWHKRSGGTWRQRRPLDLAKRAN
jgi:hypothetical protein